MSSIVGGSPSSSLLNTYSSTNACFNTATNAVGNVDYWISLGPQVGTRANGYRIFNLSTTGVISADNYLGEPSCPNQTSCITYRSATGFKGNMSGSIDAPYATYSIYIGLPNQGPIAFTLAMGPPGVSGYQAQSGKAKTGNNTSLFGDPQYNEGRALAGHASVFFSTLPGFSLSLPIFTFTGNCYTYIRALDATFEANQGYSYLSPSICHVIIHSWLYTTRPGGLYYTVSSKSPSSGVWMNSTEKGPFNPIPPTPTFPLVIGLTADNGQTINSSLTATRMAAMNLSAIIHPGDYSYGDNYAGNHEIEGSQCALVDPKGNIIANNTCRINATTVNFSFPSNWPFQAYSWRYPAPSSTLEDIGDINKATYYSTRIGSLVYLITLNNYIPFYPGTPQHTWALGAFKAYDRAVTPWLFVQFHAPIYHTYFTHYKEQECFSSIFEPLFYQYGVDMVFTGHVHAYERTHSMYNYQRDPCGTMHVTIGDGGNIEGPYRSFVDEIFPYTNQSYCELLRGVSSGPLASFTSHSGGLYITPDVTPNDPRAVTANRYGATYQIVSQPSSCPTLSFQAANGVGGGSVALPYSGPINVSGLNDSRNNYDPQYGPYGFCQSSQPDWSAYRDPSFGFATLTFSSIDVVTLRWFRNTDPAGIAADFTTILRKNSCDRATTNGGFIFNLTFSIFIQTSLSLQSGSTANSKASTTALSAEVQLFIQMMIADAWNFAISSPLLYTRIAAGDVTISTFYLPYNSSEDLKTRVDISGLATVAISLPVEIKNQRSADQARQRFLDQNSRFLLTRAINGSNSDYNGSIRISVSPDISPPSHEPPTTIHYPKKVILIIAVLVVILLIVAAVFIWIVPLFKTFRQRFQSMDDERILLMKDVELTQMS